jgi:uncharacterized repeat protein (TIGR03803 family)
VIATAAAANGAQAASGYSNLYVFCSQAMCADGAAPESPLIADESGNLYGTTSSGGANRQGTVFRLAADGTETVLYSFCSQTTCTDGANPWSGALYMDKDGDLYGTTEYGGTGTGYGHGGGVVYKLAPDGTETVLYNFCSLGGEDCTDGSYPLAGVVADRSGNLYGTTTQGGPAIVNGSYTDAGEVYKLAPDGTLTVLWGFCRDDGCTDGSSPGDGNLIMDKSGNLYGTTEFGGGGDVAYGGGTLYEVTPEGTEAVLHAFCIQFDCGDGATPYAGVVMDGNGNLYGTTALGGAYFHTSSTGGGTAYMWSPNTGTETVLHSFGSFSDGANPFGGVFLSGSGKTLYGTTTQGDDLTCSSGCGIVFSIASKNGSYAEKVLHSFAGAKDGDGAQPLAGVILKKSYLYGTAQRGGNSQNDGVVFKLGTKGGERAN